MIIIIKKAWLDSVTAVKWFSQAMEPWVKERDVASRGADGAGMRAMLPRGRKMSCTNNLI